LILDHPSLLLSTATLTSTHLSTLLLTLRSYPSVHSTLLTLPADGPFLSAAQPDTLNTNPTPIESESAAFAVQQAHNARCVLSVRELGTGAARDVSGVLRITRGGKADGDGVGEWEGLYLVGRDGVVRGVE
jgi:elongator complex protein 6